MRSSQAIVWRYLPGRKVKHALLAGHSRMANAFCGRGPIWYTADNNKWQDDEPGLAERRECSRCARAREVSNTRG